jgi:hypothetical protein
VAWYQAGRGRRIGTERQLEKAIRRLEPFAPVHRGVEVSLLLAQLRELSARGSLDLPPPDLRWSALEAAEPDGVEHPVQSDTQPPVAVEEEQQSERDQHRAADPLDDDVVVPQPAEDGHRASESDPG